MADHIAWTEAFAVGHPEIDAQHRRLVELANAVRALFGSDDHDAVEAVLAEAVEYTRTHFRDEELVLQCTAYGSLREHVIQHRMIINYIEELQADHERLTPEMMFDFLANRVLKHILLMDAGYKPFLDLP